jgi:SNF2 family DNA or RNA helicase
MIKITENDVRDLTNDIIFIKGQKYYEQGSVSSLSVDELGDYGGIETIRILGSVISDDNSSYRSFLNINNTMNITNAYCTCRTFGSHHGPCEHIIALLLRYVDESKKTFERKNNMKINNFLLKLKNNIYNINKQKKELNMDVKFCVDDYDSNRVFSLELKIGEDKKYVVKNMRNFLEVLNKRRTLEFGKGFTYDYNIHDFNKDDKEIIDILNGIYETDKKYSENHHYFGNSHKLLKGKKAILTSYRTKRLFSILKTTTFDVEIFGDRISNIKIIEEDMPIQFRIYTNGDKIIINQSSEFPCPLFNDGEYFQYKNNIYRPSINQRELYRDFYNMMDTYGEISLDISNTKDIGSYIIPALKDITSEIVVDKEFGEKFTNKPIKTSIYFDEADDIITASVRFEYGEIVINPLNKKEKSYKKVPIRDINREAEIINLLKEYGFYEDIINFVLCDEEEILNFLTVGVWKLEEISEVYYSEDFKKVKVYNSSNITTTVRLNNSDLLEFSFNIEGVDKNELKDIFEAVRVKKKYYRLKNGGFLNLTSEGINSIVHTLDYLDIKSKDLIKDKVLLSKYNSIYLDEKLRSSGIKVEKNKSFRETIYNIKEVTESDFEIPESLKGVLREYQKVGFKWLKTLAAYGFGGILADEMGLGKTLQAIAFIAARGDREEEKKPALVICPTSLVFNWENEIQKFAKELKTLVISGNKEVRLNKIKQIYDFDVIITSYPLIRNDIEYYNNTKFSCCFLDEAQHIKNPGSLSAKAVKEIKAEGYFALTGTPIENSLTELWSIFDFIMPGYLLNQNKFSRIYESPILKKNDEKALEELNKHVKPFILRRLKKDVIKELPSKIEHKVVIDMSEQQKKLYASYVAAFKEEIEEEINTVGFNKSKLKILTALTRLRQICCEPSIFIENYEGESAKMTALMEILENSIETNHRILVFSQFTSALKKIEQQLQAKKIEYMYLDGHTKSSHRISMVDEFNEGKGKVFLISLKAGGTGLNLTGADTVIHFDPWWNPAVEEQASDRVHRIGQKKTVEIIKLITKGTIEEKINILQEKKKNIINNVLQDASEQNVISEMDSEEIKELFTY